MSINNWDSISHLYLWPESKSLNSVIQESNYGQIYTTPSLKSEELLKDDVAEAIGQLHNQTFKRDDHGIGKEALKELIKQKRIKAAFNLTTKILSQAPRNSPNFEVMEIWNCRIQLMMALQMHKLAFEEMTTFGELDAPDLYLQYHPEYRQKNYFGTIVPFNFRLLHAELLKYSADMSRSYKRFCQLEDDIDSIINQNRLTSDHKLVWQKRLEAVHLSKARLLYALNDTANVVALYRQIASQTTDQQRKRQIRKMLIKFAAICGNAQLMEEFSQEIESNDYLCRSLRLIFYGKYQEAIDCFGQIRSGTDANTNLNNLAVCLLYKGQVKEAVDHLAETPILPIILNLFTIAELAATKTNDLRAQYFVRFCQIFSDMLEPRNLRIIK